MTIDDIERLLLRLRGTGIAVFEMEDGTSRLALRLPSGPNVPRSPSPPDRPQGADTTRTLKATAIGRLRLRHPEAAPDAEAPYPRTVVTGDIVAFLEAGPLLRPVVAEADGLIGPPLEPEGTLIGYGTPLFPLL